MSNAFARSRNIVGHLFLLSSFLTMKSVKPCKASSANLLNRKPNCDSDGMFFDSR